MKNVQMRNAYRTRGTRTAAESCQAAWGVAQKMWAVGSGQWSTNSRLPTASCRLPTPMSRHSKWAKIKRAKMATDVKRGQLFTKLTRAIAVAAREGGGDADTNPQLRLAMDRALAANMPKDNITRAIERAVSAGADGATTSVTLEGYGPGGAALLIDVVTDNRNRTVSDIRRILSNHGGSLGESGSVAWQFERRGLLTIENATDADALELAAIDTGAFDTEREGNALDITTPPDRLKAVQAALTAAGAVPTSSQLANVPKQSVPLDTDTMGTLERLIEALEEHDDVVEVTTNAAPPEQG